MLPEFDLNGWTGSLAIVLVMGGIITGFSAALTALISRTWGAEEDTEITRLAAGQKDTALRKAA
jgi:Na+-driven multidrug efflux pump